MTIPNEKNRIVHAGDDVTTAFTTDFVFAENAEVEAILVDDTTEVETPWVLDTDFTLTGAGSGAAGTLTATVAPATGASLVIRLKPTVSQGNSLPRGGTVSPKDVLEVLFDKIVRQVLRIKDLGDRALKAPVADVTPPGAIPNRANRTNKVLAFDGSGDPITSTKTLAALETEADAAAASAAAAAQSATDAENSFQSSLVAVAAYRSAYTEGVEFSGGSTTQLTISGIDLTGQEEYVQVHFDGVKQHESEWSLSYSAPDTTITFTAAIPAGVAGVEIDYGVRGAALAGVSISSPTISNGTATALTLHNNIVTGILNGSTATATFDEVNNSRGQLLEDAPATGAIMGRLNNQWVAFSSNYLGQGINIIDPLVDNAMAYYSSSADALKADGAIAKQVVDATAELRSHTLKNSRHTAATSGWLDRHCREVISPDNYLRKIRDWVPGSADKIKIRWRSGTGAGLEIVEAFIGQSSGDPWETLDTPYNFDAAPTRVTFDGGSNGKTVTTTYTELVSDEITFEVDPTKNIVISFLIGDATYDDIMYTSFSTDGGYWTDQSWYKTGASVGDADDLTVTAPSISNFVFIEGIEINPTETQSDGTSLIVGGGVRSSGERMPLGFENKDVIDLFNRDGTRLKPAKSWLGVHEYINLTVTNATAEYMWRLYVDANRFDEDLKGADGKTVYVTPIFRSGSSTLKVDNVYIGQGPEKDSKFTATTGAEFSAAPVQGTFNNGAATEFTESTANQFFKGDEVAVPNFDASKNLVLSWRIYNGGAQNYWSYWSIYKTNPYAKNGAYCAYKSPPAVDDFNKIGAVTWTSSNNNSYALVDFLIRVPEREKTVARFDVDEFQFMKDVQMTNRDGMSLGWINGATGSGMFNMWGSPKRISSGHSTYYLGPEDAGRLLLFMNTGNKNIYLTKETSDACPDGTTFAFCRYVTGSGGLRILTTSSHHEAPVIRYRNNSYQYVGPYIYSVGYLTKLYGNEWLLHGELTTSFT